jgi:DNA polymerase-3 subunit beta
MITINTRDFRAALTFAARVVERSASAPILNNVRITGSAAQIHLTCTDLDIEAGASLDTSGAAGLDITLPARLLIKVISQMGPEFTLVVNGDKDTATLESDDFRAEIWTLPALDFPVLAQGGDPQTIQMDVANFARALGRVIHAISNEETRYYLNGIHLAANDAGDLQATATDGHRMASINAKQPWPFIPCLLPRKTAGLLDHLMKGQTANQISITQIMVRAKVDGDKPETPYDHLAFECGNRRIRSKMIDGSFPIDGIKKHMLDVAQSEATQDITVTARALHRLPAPERSKARALVLDPKAGRMSLAMSDVGDFSTAISGKGALVGFAYPYLMDIARLSAEWRMVAPNTGSPHMVITDDPDLTYLLMPMRV